ncbi:MAG: SPOR domain-containing protein [Nitrospinae bacterium]|nr:SPOR domain-containing protein [Nitrospinota bacterium]
MEKAVPGNLPSKRRINLKYAGTGIRFPREDGAKPSSSAKPLVTLAFIAALAVGAFYYLPGGYEVPPLPKQGPAAVAELPTIAVETEETPNASPVATVPDVVVAAPPLPTEGATIELAKELPAVRFGIFVNRENAEAMVKSLAARGVSAVVAEGMHPVPAYLLKVGPLPDEAVQKKAAAALQNFTVALTGTVEQKYLIAGPIWLKEQALVARKNAQSLGLAAELGEERKERLVYKTVSLPFENLSAAQAAADAWRKQGIEGVIEK